MSKQKKNAYRIYVYFHLVYLFKDAESKEKYLSNKKYNFLRCENDS